MKERPILFSAPMVMAILAGSKSQTRRIVKPHPPTDVNAFDVVGDKAFGGIWSRRGCVHVTMDPIRCPYGQPGDRLWVRETLRRTAADGWYYNADNAPVLLTEENRHIGIAWAHHKESGVCVSIHMPRWASRITIEITEVRVQRLQEISRGDCAEEGWPVDEEKRARAIAYRDAGADDSGDDAAIEWYASLWESINGAGSWDANPWVWCISFKRVTP